MKKKIIISAIVFTLIFLLCFLYIIFTIEQGTTKLDNLITLHQVEILREHLLLQVKKVQSDLQVKNTRYARTIETVINNVRNMESTANTCFDCHHPEEMVHEFYNLQNDILSYKNAISRLLTVRANVRRLEIEEVKAYKLGEHLLEMVNDMISIASSKLESKTQQELNNIADTKFLLFILLAFGPLSIMVTSILVIKGITNPLNILLDATKKIKKGNLDFKVEGLQDEFGAVADSFNEMADSLQYSMLTIKESENRYRTLFESAGDAIFMIEAEGENTGQIISANRAAADMHGYSVEELMELNLIKDIDTPDAARAAQKRIQRILNGEWIKEEVEHFRKDGTIFPVEVSAGLLHYMGSQYILAFDRDISERKKFEEQRRESEERYAEASKAAKLGHWERNLQNNTIFWSKETYNIFGVDPDTYMPTLENFLDFVHPDDREAVLYSINTSITQEKPYNAEYRIIRPDGKERIVESKARYKSDENRDATLIVGTMQDITERKRNEEALLRSHIMFMTVLDSIDTIIYVSDIETDEILYMNYQAKDVLGDLEGKIRKHALQNFCTDDKIISPERTPRPETCICELHDADSNRWYEIRARAIEWMDGRIVRMEIAHDFTERKSTSDRLKEYLEFLQTLMNTIPLPIFYKNEEGVYTGCNRAFEEFIGMPKEEFIGKTVYDMGPEEIVDKYYIKDKELLDNPGEQVYEWKVKRRDGEVRDVVFYKATFSDATREVAGVIGAIMDITDRKRMEENLRRAEQMRLVGEWAAGLAHEIKNSLAGIKISVEVLAEEQDLSEEDRTAVMKAIDEIKRIEFLLKSLLNFAKPPELCFMATNVNIVLDHTIDFSMKQLPPTANDISQITVQKDFDKSLPETMSDSLQLKQVFMNILLNARDAMPDGGTLNARTFYMKEENAIRVEISDTGKGISEQLINKIFSPFFTTKSKGTGLGLAISKRIINQHRGTIQVANRPGGGAMFIIVIPVMMAQGEYQVQ
jgi:PAS domain S-box-containing protein